MPEFFVEDLVPSLLGDDTEDVTATARRFVSREVLGAVADIREGFAADGRVKHVCLDGALSLRVAADVGAALDAAPFRRHHHSPYRIDVAPLDELPRSRLARLCAWLGSTDGARFHTWLVGWPRGEWELAEWQVQVAHARRGDEFPVHVDSDEEGIACVYNFTRGFGPDDGGALYFPHRGRVELLVPPAFNRLTIFRPRKAPHGVSRITAPRGAHRYTVTVFYLFRPRA